MKKVLVACPIADLKAYCLDEWIQNVSSFTYPEFDVLLVDNSEDRLFYTDIKERYANVSNLKIIRVNPSHFDEFKIALAHSHELCRKHAVDNGYDYLLHLESDVFPPTNIIERLLDSGKKAIGALYHIELGGESKLMVQKIEDFGDAHRETYNLDEADLHFVDGEVKQVFSCGLGCLLLHNTILSEMHFRCDHNSPVHPDSYFFADLDAKRIPVFVDTSIYCEHKNQPTCRVECCLVGLGHPF